MFVDQPCGGTNNVCAHMSFKVASCSPLLSGWGVGCDGCLMSACAQTKCTQDPSHSRLTKCTTLHHDSLVVGARPVLNRYKTHPNTLHTWHGCGVCRRVFSCPNSSVQPQRTWHTFKYSNRRRRFIFYHRTQTCSKHLFRYALGLCSPRVHVELVGSSLAPIFHIRNTPNAMKKEDGVALLLMMAAAVAAVAAATALNKRIRSRFVKHCRRTRAHGNLWRSLFLCHTYATCATANSLNGSTS